MIVHPLRLLVTADFSPSAAPDAARVVAPAGEVVEAAFRALEPEIVVAGTTLTPRSLDDLALPALGEALGSTDSAAIHSLLQDPAFAAFEARWRALDRLASECAAHGQPVEVVLVNSRATDFDERLVSEALGEAHDHPGRGFDLVVIDHSLGMKPAHLERLGQVARWCAALGTPVVAQADPAVFGVRHSIHLGTLPDLAERIAAPKSTAAAQLRAAPESRWIALTLGRWLTRSAHVDTTVPFVEKQIPERPETLPYSSASWLAATGLCRSLLTEGHAGKASGFGVNTIHRDLGMCRVPGLLGKDTPETSTDVRFDDEAATLLLRGGFTPVLDRPQDGVAAFAVLSGLHRAAGPSLSRADSFAHQAFTGAATRFLLQLEGEARERGVSEETAAWLAGQLGEWCGGGEDCATVKVVGNGLAVSLRPGLELDGHAVEAELGLDLSALASA